MNDSGTYSTGRVKRVLWDISGAFGDIGVIAPMVFSSVLGSTIPGSASCA